jgi:hypothetical protein
MQYTELQKSIAPLVIELEPEDKTIYMGADGRLATKDNLADADLAQGISRVGSSTGLGGAYSLAAVALGADAKEAARMGSIGDGWSPMFTMGAAAVAGIRPPKSKSPPPAPPSNSSGGNRRLPIVNPHFTPSITIADAFQGATLKVSDRLNANRALIPNYLEPWQRRFASRGPWAERIVFGNAVEEALAIGTAPTGLLIHTGNIRPFLLGGPDFIGTGGTPYGGLLFQVTASPQYRDHFENSAPGTIFGVYPSHQP